MFLFKLRETALYFFQDICDAVSGLWYSEPHPNPPHPLFHLNVSLLAMYIYTQICTTSSSQRDIVTADILQTNEGGSTYFKIGGESFNVFTKRKREPLVLPPWNDLQDIHPSLMVHYTNKSNRTLMCAVNNTYVIKDYA